MREAVRTPPFKLDESTSSWLENHFGTSLSHIRFHRGPTASYSAGLLGATAYTSGNDIVLGAQAPAVTTLAGRSLLAHEAAHALTAEPGRIYRQVPATATAPAPASQAPAPASQAPAPASQAPAPLTRSQFDTNMRERFGVQSIRTLTAQDQADDVGVEPAELPNWQSWDPGDPSQIYNYIMQAMENFAGVFGGMPNVRRIRFARVRYQSTTTAAGRVVVADPSTGASYGVGDMTIHQLIGTSNKGLPVARSSAAAQYPSVTLGVGGLGNSPGAPVALPTREQNAMRIVTHELGHALESSAVGRPIQTGVDAGLMNSYMEAVGWTFAPNMRLYDVGVPAVVAALQAGQTPNASMEITEGLWNDSRWVEQPISGYMTTSPSDDFAEAVMAFLDNPALLQSRSPARYNFLNSRRSLWRRRMMPVAATGGRAGIETSINIALSSPERASMSYRRLDRYDVWTEGKGVIVSVWRDSQGYYYRYNGRIVALPGRP